MSNCKYCNKEHDNRVICEMNRLSPRNPKVVEFWKRKKEEKKCGCICHMGRSLECTSTCSQCYKPKGQDE